MNADDSPSPQVWQVVEMFERGKVSRRQEIFVLAVNAAEAAEIVGFDESRETILIHKVCDISKLPTDKYAVIARKRRA